MKMKMKIRINKHLSNQKFFRFFYILFYIKSLKNKTSSSEAETAAKNKIDTQQFYFYLLPQGWEAMKVILAHPDKALVAASASRGLIKTNKNKIDLIIYKYIFFYIIKND